jgi:hypothetical protein
MKVILGMARHISRAVGVPQASLSEGSYAASASLMRSPMKCETSSTATLRSSIRSGLTGEPLRSSVSAAGALERVEVAKQILNRGADFEPAVIDVAHLVEETKDFELQPGVAEGLAAQMVHVDGAANLGLRSLEGDGLGRVLATHLMPHAYFCCPTGSAWTVGQPRESTLIRVDAMRSIVLTASKPPKLTFA